MVPYGIDVGFAIGRLVGVFYDVCVSLTGTAGNVHFAFAGLGDGTCANLPAGFRNLLDFNHHNFTRSAGRRLADYIRTHRVTAVFALDMPASSRCPALARRAGVRSVISYYGAPMSPPNSGVRLALKRLEVRLLRRHRPDLFIFESNAMRALGVRGRGLSPSATAIIPTGVDAERFRPMSSETGAVYRRFAIPPERRIIAYMGHLHERKGVRVLMRAMTAVVRRLGRQDIHFLFLGDRAGEAAEFASEWRDARDFVTFAGYQADIPQILAGCYAGCIPSNGWDSFPMSSLEMQACGMPVIVSDCQGTPETVADGVTGIVTPAGDEHALAAAIVELVDDPDRRREMSNAARDRIETGFTRAHQVANLVKSLSPLLRAAHPA
jgi:glycosyltransferase involved in cell wall biosynthesis